MLKTSTKKALIAAGILTVAASAATVAVCRVFVDIAVKRKVMKVPEAFQNKLSGGLKKDPKVKIIEQNSKLANELPTESVQILSHDGLNLIGKLYSCEKPKRVIIAMHGWRSSWQVDYGGIVNFLHDNNCTVLFPDQRGQNDSDGEYIGFGVLERHDCLSWINYVTERFGSDVPVYLCGVSMGATTVLMTTGFDLPQNVKGVIADCGFTSPHAIWKHVLDNNLRVNEKITYPIANLICKRIANFDGDEYSTVEALENGTTPVLFIHGSDDRFVPIDMTFENYKACVAPKEMLIVPGAAHGMSYVTDTAAYEKAVLSFFKSYDK